MYICGDCRSATCFLGFHGIAINILQANNKSKQVVEVLVCSNDLQV